MCCPAACKAASTVLCFHCPSGVLCLQGLLAGPPRLGRAGAFPTVRDWPRMCWVGAALAWGLLWAQPGAGLLPDGCFGVLCLSPHPCVRASASVNYNCLAFKLPMGASCTANQDSLPPRSQPALRLFRGSVGFPGVRRVWRGVCVCWGGAQARVQQPHVSSNGKQPHCSLGTKLFQAGVRCHRRQLPA